MKRIIASFIISLCISSSFAQFISTEKLLLQKDSLYGGTSWKKIATQIKSNLPINEEKDVVYTKIVDLPNTDSDKIFDILRYWVIDNFSGSNSIIKVMDKDIGRIVIEDYIDKIVRKGEFALSDDVSLKPLIRIDIQDNKVRIMCTNSVYYVHQITYAGFTPISNDYQYKITKCYPMVKTSEREIGAFYITDNKSACKAFSLIHISSLLYLNEIEKVLTKDTCLSNKNSW